MKKADSKITKQQVINGIYLDFEGFSDKKPSLTGMIIDNHFQQVVHERTLEQAASAKGLPLISFEKTISWIIDKAETQKRKVFAYSSHELNVVHAFTNHGNAFALHYKDGRKIAKRWFNRKHYGKTIGGWGLKDFMEFLCDPIPKYFGQSKATKTLKYIMEMLPKKNTYEELTPAAKKGWTNLLTYNKWDCHALQKLMRTVSQN